MGHSIWLNAFNSFYNTSFSRRLVEEECVENREAVPRVSPASRSTRVDRDRRTSAKRFHKHFASISSADVASMFPGEVGTLGRFRSGGCPDHRPVAVVPRRGDRPGVVLRRPGVVLRRPGVVLPGCVVRFPRFARGR